MNKRFKTPPYIRYANVYEDSNTVISSANLIKNKKSTYLSVASGIDNVLTLLLTNPSKIYAFDYNITQIYLADLKIKAFKYLTYQELFNFLGLDNNKNERLINYKKISNYLKTDTKDYFDKHQNDIKNIGIINMGRFEYYLRLFGKKILPLIHSKKTINKFFSFDNIEEQKRFYETKFNNKRFQKMFKFFFSQKVMSKLGRDKDYFIYVSSNVETNLKHRIDTGFSTILNKDNPYMQYIILGKFITLPEYLKKENYKKIKSSLDNIELIYGDLDTITNLDVKFDFLNLSDIFEYMNKEDTKKAEKQIINLTNNQGIIIFWNMMVLRSFTDSSLSLLPSTVVFKEERPFFYQNLWRYQKNVKEEEKQ